MARNKYPEVTVEKILEVSQRLFLTNGYDNTTIQDIVEELGGLTRGAIYHHFKSMGVQILLRETYLPIDMTNVVSEEDRKNKEEVEEHETANDYIIEPNVEELIASLIPTVLSQKIFTAAVDSNASEHAARTLAMQVATDNANELIQDLTKQYNKSRQQAITNELLDIVGGSMK